MPSANIDFLGSGLADAELTFQKQRVGSGGMTWRTHVSACYEHHINKSTTTTS